MLFEIHVHVYHHLFKYVQRKDKFNHKLVQIQSSHPNTQDAILDVKNFRCEKLYFHLVFEGNGTSESL